MKSTDWIHSTPYIVQYRLILAEIFESNWKRYTCSLYIEHGNFLYD